MIICDYIKKINSPLSKVYKGDELVMTTDRHYLTFTALQAGSTVKFNRTGVTSEYSIDGGNTWNSADNVTVTLSNIKDTVMYRGVTTSPSSSVDTPAFTLTGQIKAFGNVTSMINSDPYNTSLNNKNHAFRYYFYNQSALKDISKLILPSSSTLTEGCYTSMFEGTDITTIPNNFLRATTLANSCYQGMFADCTGLTNVPNLPATTLAIGCYSHMFEDCSGLTTLPENYLPVTRICDNCYASMFAGCTNITTAPILPATYLANSCYQKMFDGCSKLNEVRTYAENIEATNCIDNWLNNVAPTGNFYNIGDATYTTGGSGIPEGWTEHIPPQPLSFTALEAGSTVKFSRTGVTSEYSTDYGNTWNSADDVTVTLYNVGDKVMYRGITSSPSYTVSTPAFTLTGQVKASGVVNSMINKDPEDINLRGMGHALRYYFSNQTALKDINKLRLPSTTLTTYCYSNMFTGCTGLTTIPNNLLSATSLGTYCYSNMFQGCTGLTEIPANLLPARSLANYCYLGMFSHCTNLTSVPANLLPATTLANRCYYGMFLECTSLNTLPNLPATTLKNYCYGSMFSGCTGLTTVPANLLSATTLAENCCVMMFAGCTGITTTPNLRATELANHCYESMFSGCTKLKKVVSYARFIGYTGCLDNWLEDVASKGDFYNLGGANTYPSGASGIPEGWTVHTTI